MTGKKRILQNYLIIVGAATLVFIYLGLKTAPFIGDEDFFVALDNLLNSIKTEPFRIVICSNSLKSVLFSFILDFMLALLLLSSVRNYRYGEEHGSSKWGSAKQICKKYEDKNGGNLMLTQNTRISFNDEITNLNANAVIVGGPGTGKTFRFVMPNVINAQGSMVICDPKGSTLKKTGKYLKKEGYSVKVLDLKNPERSWGYNPFVYIRNEDDIFKMVELIFDANTPKDTKNMDPFFDDNAKFLFLACCYYLWQNAEDEKEMNIPFVLDMINYLEIRDDDLNYISPFDELFLDLQKEEPNNIAVDYYLKFRQAKGRTAMSVVSSLVAKIGKYSLPSIKSMSIHDELELKTIADKKTALFLLLPDDDKSKNFICSVLYMQLFQQLYDRAEETNEDRLPLHVQVYMDEFANISLSDEFDTIIATCRSRNIGICVILQGLSQLKKIFKEYWETITAQCSTFLYLGGMEQSTHEYLSKVLDKETIYTNSFGESRGRQGNFTKNDQLSGRELLTPGEVRLLKKGYAIMVLQGEPPILDRMIDTQKMKEFIFMKALGNYNHSKVDIDIPIASSKPIPFSSEEVSQTDEVQLVNVKTN